MFGSEVLEVATGLVFVFLVTSLAATAVRELIESILKTRAIQLERGLRMLLDDPTGTGVTKELFDHPLLYGLFEGDYQPEHLAPLIRSRLKNWLPEIWAKLPISRAAQAPPIAPTNQPTAAAQQRVSFSSNLPNYIPSRNFALALLDLVGASGSSSGGSGVLDLAAIKANALSLPEGRVRQAVLVALGEAGDNLERAKISLEAWFDGTMDRVSGWYKRETQWILFAIGIAFAVPMNIDAIGITRDLATNNTLRQEMLVRVDAAYRDLDPKAEGELKGNLSDIVGGWSRVNFPKDGFLTKPGPWIGLGFRLLIGWLLTGVAVSLGAPFWFDLLNKFMVIRSTVKPTEKSPSAASEDRGKTISSAAELDRLVPAASSLSPASRPPSGRPTDDLFATIRLAVDKAQLSGIRVTLDGQPVELDNNGHAEVPLKLGAEHRLEARASRDGQTIFWARSFASSVDNEGLPVSPEWQAAASGAQ
jgi:hypothetical protein